MSSARVGWPAARVVMPAARVARPAAREAAAVVRLARRYLRPSHALALQRVSVESCETAALFNRDRSFRICAVRDAASFALVFYARAS